MQYRSRSQIDFQNIPITDRKIYFEIDNQEFSFEHVTDPSVFKLTLRSTVWLTDEELKAFCEEFNIEHFLLDPPFSTLTTRLPGAPRGLRPILQIHQIKDRFFIEIFEENYSHPYQESDYPYHFLIAEVELTEDFKKRIGKDEHSEPPINVINTVSEITLRDTQNKTLDYSLPCFLKLAPSKDASFLLSFDFCGQHYSYEPILDSRIKSSQLTEQVWFTTTELLQLCTVLNLLIIRDSRSPLHLNVRLPGGPPEESIPIISLITINDHVFMEIKQLHGTHSELNDLPYLYSLTEVSLSESFRRRLKI